MILMLTGCQIQPDRGTETGSSSLKEEKKTESTKSETTTEQVDIAQEPAEMIRLRIERQYYEGPDVTEGGTVFLANMIRWHWWIQIRQRQSEKHLRTGMLIMKMNIGCRRHSMRIRLKRIWIQWQMACIII